ncbi:DUF3732 domain-containing protein [Spirosoma sp. KCTC 42546]|uniref:DUF3732 domain-containing protein n=1 Tax=Spirosoma sp. KCTC 42546 TaxID=2520506 RepID=UPI00143CF8EF|nr:DUF3732 domain-containing protein [Spirosoma sp. KCTC 42546]
MLNFELGKVNIITGESKTGKTSLLDIIDFCLGSDEFRVAEGRVRENVLWFAVLLQLKAGQLLIARPNPTKKFASGCCIIQEDEIAIPSISELHINSTSDALKTKLTSLIGIAEYTHQAENFTRPSLTVNFKHSRIYCFQPQTDIDQRDFLFYHQKKDSWTAQAIKDTLPYFLGAIREDVVKIERDINEKRRNLNRLERELKENENISQQAVSKAFELLIEAKQVELIDNNIVAENQNQALNLLNEILTREVLNVEPISENANLLELQNQRNDLKQEIDLITDNIKAAEGYEKDAFKYTNEAKEQNYRLESIGLFVDKANALNDICPLCSQTIESHIPTIKEITESLQFLKDNLEVTQQERPRLTNYISELQKQREEIKKRILSTERNINAIYKEREQSQKLQDLNVRKGRVFGRISLYLESSQLSSATSSLRQAISSLHSQIETLEQLLSKDDKDEKLEIALDQLSILMTNWSKELDLEFQDALIKFSIKYLTLFIITQDKKIRFDQDIGSGENWVSYHLLIHFALHKYFIINDRPVPNFLLIDQLSQAYFPPEKDTGTGNTEQSSDEVAIKRLFDFVFRRVEELDGKFQVILIDHAKLKDGKFQSAIIEEWRNGVKLIPLDWFIS